MKKYFPHLIVILATFLLAWIFWNRVFLSPNSYMFNASGDGLKNYYTPAYYISYDQGLQFSGMNYPYGEHIVFTDNQPALSLFLNRFSYYIYDLSPYTVGILNLLMLLSIIPCTLILYLILRKSGLPFWYSLAASIFIGLMSPQLLRFSGHYALSYTFFIPLAWFILIHLFDRANFIKWAVCWILALSLFSLIHPYYLMMGLLFGLAYLLVHLLGNRGQVRKMGGFYLNRLLILVLPLIFFRVFLMLTDPIADRPENPYGIFLYQSNIDSVFLPAIYPLNNLASYIFNLKQEPEGLAYIGLIPLLIFLFSLIKSLRQIIFVNFKRILSPSGPAFIKTSLGAASLVLIFSFGFPIDQFPGILNILTPLKQFRGLGRFAWVFYYAFTVYAAFYLYSCLRYIRMRSRPVAYYSISLAFLIWGFEAYNCMRYTKESIVHERFVNRLTNPLEGYGALLKKNGFSAGDFQAIMALPYFMIGSEKWSIEGDYTSTTEGMRASLNLGLPLTEGMMSRTSFSQSAKLIQLAGGEMIPKESMKDFKDNRPLLLLTSVKNLDSNSIKLARKAIFIADTAGVKLYKLPLDSLQPAYEKINRRLPDEKIGTGELYISRKTKAVLSEGFDNSASRIFNFNQGAMQKQAGALEIFKGKINADSSRQVFEASLWVYAKTDTFFPLMVFRQYNAKQEMIEEAFINPKQFTEFSNDWLRINHHFILTEKENAIEILMEGNGIITDNLLIRPVNTDVASVHEHHMIFNNYYVPR